tara:strand:- start:405 stop:551 length:147 start_codon:yes stop_codon:yes gene_type:complete
MGHPVYRGVDALGKGSVYHDVDRLPQGGTEANARTAKPKKISGKNRCI